MSVTLRIATPDDLDRLATMVALCHGELGIEQDDETLRTTLAMVLGGLPQGVAYLIGPPRAPVGYAVVSFGFCLERGGLDATVDEVFIRPAVRGRGMGSEALAALATALGGHGVKALHVEVATDSRPAALYRRLGFAPRDATHLMTRRL